MGNSWTKGGLAALAFCAAGFAMGQTTEQRVDAIWAVAANQMLTQQDAWFEDGDFPACISILNLEAAKYPKDYEIWTNLGWMHENVEEWDAAQATYLEYQKQNPTEPDRSLPLAQYFFMKKKYQMIPDILEPIVKVPAEQSKCHPNNYRILAWSYEKLKKYPDAVRVWKTYLATGVTDATAKRNMGRDEQRSTGSSTR